MHSTTLVATDCNQLQTGLYLDWLATGCIFANECWQLVHTGFSLVAQSGENSKTSLGPNFPKKAIKTKPDWTLKHYS